ncbi:MAG: dual specificity protein phosphatase family protein, partial [Pseudomonadales bacterium]
VVEQGEIYRSGQLHGTLVSRVLEENKIKVVIDLQYFEDKPNILAEMSAIEQLGITQYRFPLNGNGTGDIESYVSAIRQIHESVGRGEPVLVHCSAGAQRTGGVLAAYRTLLQGKSVDFVTEEMARYDWDPDDDRAVLQYLDENIEVLAQRLVEEGVLAAPPEQMPRFL